MICSSLPRRQSLTIRDSFGYKQNMRSTSIKLFGVHYFDIDRHLFYVFLNLSLLF